MNNLLQLKAVISYIENGFILKQGTLSVVNEKVTVGTFFLKIKKHVSNAINSVSVQKPNTVVTYKSPSRFLLLIR